MKPIKVTSKNTTEKISTLEIDILILNNSRRSAISKIEKYTNHLERDASLSDGMRNDTKLNLEREILALSNLEKSLEISNQKILDLDEAHSGPLVDCLTKINGNASTYTQSPSQVVQLAKDTEQALEARGVTKKNRIGSVVE